MSGSSLRLGVLIPTRAAIIASARRPPLEECWAMARHADAAGYDAVWVGDSIVARPRLDVITTLGYLAAMTSRVRLGTAVLLPSLRQPVVLAHQLANIDQMSRGRLVLGIGVGGSDPSLAAEWAAAGMPFRRRARQLEEHVAVWRRLWSGEPVSYEGSGFTLSNHTIGPLPWTEEGPPVLITAGNGGQVVPAAIDRFGRLGNGIITTRIDPEECRPLREQGEAALARHGRSLPAFPIVAYTTVRVDDDAAAARRVHEGFLRAYYGPRARDRGSAGIGAPDTVIEALRRYADNGVTDVCVRFAGEDQMAQLERFTRDVLPAFAGAGAGAA